MTKTDHQTSTFRFADSHGWKCICGAGWAEFRSQSAARAAGRTHERDPKRVPQPGDMSRG